MSEPWDFTEAPRRQFRDAHAGAKRDHAAPKPIPAGVTIRIRFPRPANGTGDILARYPGMVGVTASKQGAQALPAYQDPGYLRHCLLPSCEAVFNVAEVFTGIAAAPGWRLLRFFGAVYLCPVHAVPCVNGDHLPRWGADVAVPGMRGIGCECGWHYRPPAPSTLGDYENQWITHLAESFTGAATAAGEGAPCPTS